MDDAQRTQLRGQLRLLGFAAVVVLFGGLVSGVLFGRLNPESAASRQLLDFDVFEEDLDAAGTQPDLVERLELAPTSGQPRGTVRCGVRDTAVSLDDQRATVAAGRVVVQHGPDVSEGRRSDLEELVADDPTAFALAPAPDALALVGDELVLTGWLWRLGPQAVAPGIVAAFQIAHGGNGPLEADCG